MTKEKILRIINKNHRVSTALLVQKLNITPQAVHKHLNTLIKEGVILKQGSSRKTSYYILNSAESIQAHKTSLFSKTFTNIDLQEDQIFREIKSQIPYLHELPQNIEKILHYAFTEMMNNAIDHSQSKVIQVIFSIQASVLTFSIDDKGIGIFENIQKKKKLKDEMEAIQELLKGKQTTQPDRHSGEGIFFTSKISDLFFIRSHKKTLTFNNAIHDIFIQDSPQKKGTLVHFEINKNSAKNLNDIWEQYTGEEFEFNKSLVTVKLFKEGTDFISRSQAKRILSNLDSFKKIVLDFKGVETVGQGFADEVFRVFQNQHPEIEITPLHMHENVEFMVKRALANT